MFEEFLEKIESKTTEESNSRDVIRSDASTFNRKSKIKANLTSEEKNRLINQTKIFWDTYFKILPKYQKDTKGETKVVSGGIASQTAAEAQKVIDTEQKKTKSGLLGLLGKLLGLGALTKFAKPIFKFLGKKLGEFAKFLARKIKDLLGKAWSKIKSRLSKAWKALKTKLRDLGKKIRNIVKRGLNKVAGFFKDMWKKFKESKFFKGLKKTVGKGVQAAKKALGKVKDFILKGLTKVVNFFKGALSKIPGIGKLFPSLSKDVAKSTAKEAATKAAEKPGFFKRIGGAVVRGAKAAGGAVVKRAKAAGGAVVRGAKAAGGAVVKGAKAVGGAAISTAKSGVGKALGKALGKGGSAILGFLGGVGRRIPIIGPAIEALFTAKDIKDLKDKYAAGEISVDELQQKAGTRAITGITGLVGSGAGAFLGGLGGTVIPVAGNFIGTLLGALAGDALGRFAGKLLADYIIPPKYTSSIGAFFTGTQPPQREMQDFIIQRGKVMPFSSKDEVMGIKKGGAIGEFMSGSRVNNNMVIKKAVQIIRSELAKSNVYLEQIANNTKLALKLQGNTGGQPIAIPNNSSSPPAQSQINTPESMLDSRADYFNSPYSINVPGVMA